MILINNFNLLIVPSFKTNYGIKNLFSHTEYVNSSKNIFKPLLAYLSNHF